MTMSAKELEQAKIILETIHADLKREKEAVVALLQEPRVAEWQTIDLKKYQALLSAMGVDPDQISSALVEYPQQAKRIAKQIFDWGNELGNQKADLIGQPDPAAALAAARRLEGKILGLAALQEALLANTNRLVLADQALRQQLGFKSMLVIAKRLNSGKQEVFDGGLATLNLLVANANEGGSSLQELCQEPDKLEARLKHLDVTKLPRLVEEILFHHIDEAIAASREIGIFLVGVNGRMAREFESIEAIERGLKALDSTGTAALLDGLSQQLVQISILVSSLYHKRSFKDTVTTVVEALDALNVFYLLLKNKIIPGLQKEVEAVGSMLNPATIAATMTKSFFTGTAGIIRSLKLMMNSIAGKPAVNEAELQLTLENGIANCKTFYGKSQADLKKITHYIDSLVGQQAKPFPYNDLFRLTKITLSTYGEAVEKFLRDYDVPKTMLTMTTGTPPTKAGGVLTTIANHKKAFQKANAEAS